METLVVIAVVAIIAALLLPVLVGAKKQARATDSLSRMHQLGLAGALYHDQAGQWPRSTQDLVDARLVPSGICASPTDASLPGQANVVATGALVDYPFPHGKTETDYKNSYVGQRELLVSSTSSSRWAQELPTGGWLIDATGTDPHGDVTLDKATGTYRRLLYDTSVLNRRFGDVACGEGDCRMRITYFVDPDEEMSRWIKRL